VAEALLDRGANADFPDPDGSTPLYAAAFQGNMQCLTLMLQVCK
jgi:ankyrin repeat protein